MVFVDSVNIQLLGRRHGTDKQKHGVKQRENFCYRVVDLKCSVMLKEGMVT